MGQQMSFPKTWRPPKTPKWDSVMAGAEEDTVDYHASIEKAKSELHRFPLIMVDRTPLMSHIAENFDKVRAFVPDPRDILIATYPKAGTTWTQEIVDLLLNNGDEEACKRAPTPVRSPFLEIFSPEPIPSGLDLLSKMEAPRMIKTHLPFYLVPESFWDKKCKTIYVARNAKDNLVSYFHFDRMNQTQPEPGPWDGYIHKFMQGSLGWGSWYDHVKGYWVERQTKNILYIFFEDMKENPRREVKRIMNYLELSVSDEVIDRIVKLTTFEKMKDNPMSNYSCIPTEVFDHTISPFMRKGEVGNWREHFTPEQAKMFDEDYKKQMRDVDIPFRDLI